MLFSCELAEAAVLNVGLTQPQAVAEAAIAGDDKYRVDGHVAPRSRPRGLAEQQESWSRVIDIVVAATLLIAALPFLILLAAALQIDSPGRLFFVQKRVGRGGVLFPCIKFRTMCKDADAVLARHLETVSSMREEWLRDFKLRNDPRVTRLGAIVRKLSLDEFPQLVNILLGHMSLVGPRPIVPAEIERYGRFFDAYCAVRPGLTGLWQVSGRNDITYRRRVLLDRYYVRRRSLRLNLAILARTVPAVLTARGSC